MCLVDLEIRSILVNTISQEYLEGNLLTDFVWKGCFGFWVQSDHISYLVTSSSFCRTGATTNTFHQRFGRFKSSICKDASLNCRILSPLHITDTPVIWHYCHEVEGGRLKKNNRRHILTLASETLDPTFSHNAAKQHLLKPPCLQNANFFYSPHLPFVTHAVSFTPLAQRKQITSSSLDFSSFRNLPQSHRRHYTTVLTRQVVIPVTNRLNFVCRIGASAPLNSGLITH